MKNADLKTLLQKLRDDGILPKDVTGIPDSVPRLYAAQLAQIIRSAVEQFQRKQDEESLLLLLLIA